MEEIIISPSCKYKCIISEDITTLKNYNKYVNVKLIDTLTDKKIYEYEMIKNPRSYSNFIVINNNEWWFGGREYMLKLFVNMTTGEVYDDPNQREKSDEFKNGTEFIWTNDCIVSPNNKMILICGYSWPYTYERKVYDISDLSNGYKEMCKDIYIIDESNHTFRFITDNEIGEYTTDNILIKTHKI